MKDASRAEEVAAKIELVQRALGPERAVRLRGIDWFAWMTAGGYSAVLLAADTGIAEVVVTASGAWVVTDEIEAQRLTDEEIPEGLPVRAVAWAHPAEKEHLVQELTRGRQILSDRPAEGEGWLPLELPPLKRRLLPGEIERYRQVGRLSAEAMSEALREATPEWTEAELAGAGARALLSRGLDPGLIMAVGERRLPLYRHPVTKTERIGSLAMMVFCARGYGLYANLTRFVSFGPLPEHYARLHEAVYQVEARALELSAVGMELKSVYQGIERAYVNLGFKDAIREHHQGGTTGYLSREVVANPGSTELIGEGTALAWNPSVRGAKVEDTFVVTRSGLMNLTVDPAWPAVNVAGRERPQVLER